MQKLRVNNPEAIKKGIQAYLKSPNGRFIHRLHGILLMLESPDYNCNHVGAKFNNSPRTISNWVHKINTTGSVSSLIDAPRHGRKPRLTADQEEQIKKALLNTPDHSGIDANQWDGKTLSFYIQQTFQIGLKVRQCQRLMKKLGFTLQKPRTVPAPGDPDAKEAYKKLQQKRNTGQYEIFFQDECRFQRTCSTTRSWYLKGKGPTLPSPVGKEKVSIAGAVSQETGSLFVLTASTFNAVSLKRFLQKFFKKSTRRKKKKTLLVLDNAQYHKAKELNEYLEEVKDRLGLLFLPPYCPDLNPIEMVWREIKREVTNYRYFPSLTEQKQKLLLLGKCENGSENNSRTWC
jgi:transposase